MSLSYKIEVERRPYYARIRTVPSEWACEVSVSIDYPGRLSQKLRVIPGWSCGARDWTIDEARTFFKAGLDALDAAEKELASWEGGLKCQK